jgi:hypothetical protein
MRNKSDDQKNTTPKIECSSFWRLKTIAPMEQYKLHIEFLDGTTGIFDMHDIIMSPNAGVFAALKDKKIFDKVYLELGVATWPGGIDFSPDAMYEKISD